ncbi:SMODS domain-containing nucleotidyltransferase [Pedobacter roseus]|uniref:Nucleotidyltransferase n=1 Tax=Pedobacter roseus TaxID=336820 RepID=A0A7G9QMB8_9SPHI|nr:nucleotidyltransferase [Pedobacter roseus]QNN44493.1 nucleotidyltransferase [Pedobacter roseus]
MAKTLEQGFDTFISWLIPLKTEHDKAASHKDSVQRCLKNSHECTRMFETGSFGAGTGVRHFSDTDYFAVIPTRNLKENSATSLTIIKETLQNSFPRTEGIAVRSPAVKIPFGTYASETMEITPCDSNGVVKTAYGNFNQYQIANGENGWKNSSPSAHNAYVSYHDKRLSGKLKPLIQLVKAWKYYNDVPLTSFYLELRVTRYAESETSIVYDIDLYRFFKYLNDYDIPSVNDPLGITGRITGTSTSLKRETALSKVRADFKRAEAAYTARSSDLDLCFEKWNMFFNYEFPSR